MDEVAKGTQLGVVSHQLLVVEAVRFLLQAAHRAVYGVVWHPGEPLHRAEVARFDVGILFADLGSPQAVGHAAGLIATTPKPWLVVTDHPPGPAWGALLSSGRVLVRSGQCTAEDLVALAEELADPERDLSRHIDRAKLLAEWAEWNQAAIAFRERLITLSRRERTVLERMNEGLSATEIARQLGVSTGTIRTQVKSMRRKLGVGSQLAAVAALHRYVGSQAPEPPLPSPRRRSNSSGQSSPAVLERSEPLRSPS